MSLQANMLALTPRERKVLLIIGCLVFAGALIRLFTKDNARSNATCAYDPTASRTFNQSHTSLAPQQAKVIFPLNVNTASLHDLDALPGVGPEIAQRIIDHRQSRGNFTTPDDLRNVSGIGEKKLEKIKELITF